MIVLSLVVLAVAGVLLVVGILQGDAGTVFLAASIGTTVLAAVLLYFGVRPRAASPASDTDRAGRGGEAGRSPALAAVGGYAATGASGAVRGGVAPAGGESTGTGSTGAGSTGKTPTSTSAGPAKGGTTAGSDGTTEGGASADTAPAQAGARGQGQGHAARGAAADGTAPNGTPPNGTTSGGTTSGVRAAAGAVAQTAVGAQTVDGAPGHDEDPPDEPAIERASLGELARVAARDDEVVVVDGRPRYHLVDCAHLAGREFEGLPVSEAAELGFTPCARCAPVAVLNAR
jgi:hypothetical protein